MPPLSPDEIARRLRNLDGWSLVAGEIEKTYRFPTFPQAIAFVGRVADLAEKVDHHPEIDIRYNRVKLRLSTHSEKGITERDFALASDVDRAEPEFRLA